MRKKFITKFYKNKRKSSKKKATRNKELNFLFWLESFLFTEFITNRTEFKLSLRHHFCNIKNFNSTNKNVQLHFNLTNLFQFNDWISSLSPSHLEVSYFTMENVYDYCWERTMKYQAAAAVVAKATAAGNS